MRLEDLIKKREPSTQIPVEINYDIGHILKEAEEELNNDNTLEEESVETLIPDYLLNDPEIVGYPDDTFQSQIYEWVVQHMDLLPFADMTTIKDYGCGRGDFGRTFNSTRYIGIDSNPVLINAGKQKYSELNLICDDYLNVDTITDYTVCIGTLNDIVGEIKWGRFDKTLNKAIQTSNTAVIFVLQRKADLDGFHEYPIEEVIPRIPSNLPFKIDYQKFEDIYVLVVYTQPFS